MEHSKEITINSDLSLVDNVVQEIYGFLDGKMIIEDHCHNLSVALSEALNNAIIHGNKNDKTKKVNVKVTINSNMVEFRVKDEGEGFKPEEVPDPCTEENLCKPTGRGLHIIRHFMDEVEFKNDKTGTLVVMRKKAKIKDT
ncbi:ATP-binding protein [bacterium]|nr:ATP-binding protein [bacterium]